jgi:hypothetical protein
MPVDFGRIPPGMPPATSPGLEMSHRMEIRLRPYVSPPSMPPAGMGPVRPPHAGNWARARRRLGATFSLALALLLVACSSPAGRVTPDDAGLGDGGPGVDGGAAWDGGASDAGTSEDGGKDCGPGAPGTPST